MPEVDHECVHNVIDESEPFAMFCSICDKRMPKPEYRGIAGYARAVDTSKPLCPEVETTTVKFKEDWDEVARIMKCTQCSYRFVCLDVGYTFCPWCARKIIWE